MAGSVSKADPKTVLITGASSGIGAALARAYARQGRHLALTGRDAARLEAVAADCESRGGSVETAILEVTNRAAMEAWLLTVDARSPIDLVIANAGVSAGTGGAGEDAEQARRVMAVNLDGMLNTVLPLIDRMRARGRGQIAVMSSLAGFRGIPGAPAYCAAKAAVRVYGEAIRGDLARDGVSVSVIAPGFVESPMTAVNRFRMPMLMSADKAAARIRDGLARRRGRIAFPVPMYMAAWLLAALPDWLAQRVGGGLPRKPAS